ncbi:MAG: TetR/AcrR family transcriptional regulator [Lachnospiraceae bacterium]|nr:TetR/AcrR family transcriptional regulator [Lachnospiraceae bacterium]
MNTVVTSKEDILKTSRKLIQQQGWSAINIRSVAAACGVSVGSIYNYFGSKAALVCATVESVWSEIFHRSEDGVVFQDTQACIVWIYERMEYGSRLYPGFFTLHSLGFMQEDKSDGKQRMQQTWQHIMNGLCSVLKRDARVRADAFTEQFTAEKFADVLFSLMLSALLRQDYDPSAVLEIVSRTLYRADAVQNKIERGE